MPGAAGRDGCLGPDAAARRGRETTARRRSATSGGFFTTADTVEDLDALRRALGERKLALDGTSYGTYVAQRYALAHPDNVSRLVLDSVVPADGISLLSIDPIQAAERVLGEDTTRDLATVVKNEKNGPQMLDMLTGLSVGAPRGNGGAAGARSRRGRQHRPARRPAGRRLARDEVLDGGEAQPGPAREHAVRRHAGALGRRVGAARGPQRGARERGGEAQGTTCTRSTARPRPATASPSSA